MCSVLGAFRGACPHRAVLTTSVRARPVFNTFRPAAVRVFTSTRIWSKDDSRTRSVQRDPKAEFAASAKVDTITPIKLESIQKEKPAEPKKPSLLVETNVSNKEQRKADWAIIKDMAHYLWPKNDFSTRFRVGLSVALLVGAKVPLTSFMSFLQSQ